MKRTVKKVLSLLPAMAMALTLSALTASAGDLTLTAKTPTVSVGETVQLLMGDSEADVRAAFELSDGSGMDEADRKALEAAINELKQQGGQVENAGGLKLTVTKQTGEDAGKILEGADKARALENTTLRLELPAGTVPSQNSMGPTTTYLLIRKADGSYELLEDSDGDPRMVEVTLSGEPVAVLYRSEGIQERTCPLHLLGAIFAIIILIITGLLYKKKTRLADALFVLGGLILTGAAVIGLTSYGCLLDLLVLAVYIVGVVRIIRNAKKPPEDEQRNAEAAK